MGLEALPEWAILLVGIAGLLGAGAMFTQWVVRTVKTSWYSNGNGVKSTASSVQGRSCPMDSSFVTTQLTNCEASREQAAVRDQEMLSLLKQILGELQAIRGRRWPGCSNCSAVYYTDARSAVLKSKLL